MNRCEKTVRDHEKRAELVLDLEERVLECRRTLEGAWSDESLSPDICGCPDQSAPLDQRRFPPLAEVLKTMPRSGDEVQRRKDSAAGSGVNGWRRTRRGLTRVRHVICPLVRILTGVLSQSSNIFDWPTLSFVRSRPR